LEAVPAYRPAPRVRPEVAWSLARLTLDGGMLLAAAAARPGSRAVGVDAAPAGWLALFAVLVVGRCRPRMYRRAFAPTSWTISAAL
jgi:hypothetical protein